MPHKTLSPYTRTFSNFLRLFVAMDSGYVRKLILYDMEQPRNIFPNPTKRIDYNLRGI
jgi:hypothetical protein